jgi:hypothetical protein
VEVRALKKVRKGKKTPPLGRAYVTVMKEKEIWGRVEFYGIRSMVSLMFSLVVRIKLTSYIRFSLFQKEKVDCWRVSSGLSKDWK